MRGQILSPSRHPPPARRRRRRRGGGSVRTGSRSARAIPPLPATALIAANGGAVRIIRERHCYRLPGSTRSRLFLPVFPASGVQQAARQPPQCQDGQGRRRNTERAACGCPATATRAARRHARSVPTGHATPSRRAAKGSASANRLPVSAACSFQIACAALSKRSQRPAARQS